MTPPWDGDLGALAARFGPRYLPHGFILTRDARSAAPDGWTRRELNGWALHSGPRANVLDVVTADGCVRGWLIGHAIDVDRRVVLADALRLDLAGSALTPTSVDEEVHRLGGRYVVIVLDPFEAVFPDAYGTYPVFFSPDDQAVASNPFLLPRAGEAPVASPLAGTIRVHETGMVFGCGATAFEGVEHALPNHALDLGAWSLLRTWPRESIESAEVEEAGAIVGDHVGRSLEAAARAGALDLCLTAGADSRLLLACARPFAKDVGFFTIAFPDDLGATDVRWAPRVASHARISHRTLSWCDPTTDDIALFHYRTGCMTGERRGRRAAPSYAQLGGTGAIGFGVLGEYLSGRDTRPGDAVDEAFDATSLLRRLELPLHPELVARAERWLSSPPPGNWVQRRGLAQLELYDSAWGGLFPCGYVDAGTFCFYPLAHRAVIEAALSVPAEARRADRLRRAVIGMHWPELLELPLNRVTPRVAAIRRWRRARGRAAGAVGRIRRRDFRRP